MEIKVTKDNLRWNTRRTSVRLRGASSCSCTI